MRTIVKILVLIVVISNIALAEFPWIYPPVGSLDPEGEIDFLVHMESYEEASAKYLEIASSTSDPATKATALLNAAHLQANFNRNKTAARALYQEMINNFPGSRFEILGQIGILDVDYPKVSEERLSGINQILESRNAPSLSEVQDGPIDAAVRMIEQIPPEFAYTLSELYLVRAFQLKNTGFREEALNISRFGRRSLDPVGFERHNDFLRLYLGILATDAGISPKDLRAVSKDPVISTIVPTDGQTVGSNVQIQIELTAGDYRHAQIDLQSLEVVLDGQDVTYDLSIDSIADESLTEGVNFERVVISLNRVLPQGEHTIALSVRTVQALNFTFGEASKSWNFFVSDAPPPPLSIKTTADSTLIIREPHQNEGANPRLHLKKVTGKPAQVVVGFDTTNLDTTGLTKASLVLNIDSTQNVRPVGEMVGTFRPNDS